MEIKPIGTRRDCEAALKDIERLMNAKRNLPDRVYEVLTSKRPLTMAVAVNDRVLRCSNAKIVSSILLHSSSR